MVEGAVNLTGSRGHVSGGTARSLDSEVGPPGTWRKLSFSTSLHRAAAPAPHAVHNSRSDTGSTAGDAMEHAFPRFLHRLWKTLWRGRPQPPGPGSDRMGRPTKAFFHKSCGQVWKNGPNMVKTPPQPANRLWMNNGCPQPVAEPGSESTGSSTRRHAPRRAAPLLVHIFHSTDDEDETPDQGASPDNEGGKRPTRPVCPRSPDPVVLVARGRLVSEPQWSFVEK